MTPSSKKKSGKPEKKAPENNEHIVQLDQPTNLSEDPEFAELLAHYQKAEFSKCLELLETLEARYPDHPELLEIKDDLQMRASVKDLSKKMQKGERRKKIREKLNLVLFAIIGTIIATLVFLFSYNYLRSRAAVEQVDRVAEGQSSQLAALNGQANQLILIGKPQEASEIIDEIREIDPDYENLTDLTERNEALLQLDEKYQSALDLIDEGQKEEALVLLKEIEAEKPGLWGIPQEIDAIESEMQLAQYLAEGNAAYENENWDQVISAYESALAIDSNLNDPMMKEQLFRGYLNKMITMLRDENASIEEIEKAEQYYRKAVALFPQNREFTSEKINLQELGSDLLVLKYTEMAQNLLADKNQTAATVATAVSYTRKAGNIKPKNSTLQQELQNAEYYQLAFQKFVEMDWTAAIENLTEIMSKDANFANGNAKVLLFEAYYALSKQYYSAGLYQDAVTNLEQAELLAWADQDNLLKLFQVQVFMGDNLGGLELYEDAVSYYKFALDSVKILPKLTNYPVVTGIYSEANIFAGDGNFERAFERFQTVFKNIDFIYTVSEVEIGDRVLLAFFADENNSTLEAVIVANELPQNMVISFGRALQVPTIEN